MAWLKSRPIAWLDISTYCNAGCPQCHRTNPKGLDKQNWLPLMQWNIDTFKNAFPDPDRFKKFDFCGTWGDPVMNKDLMKMIEYIMSNSSTARVGIDTNGSIRDPDWWWKLGIIGGDRLEVTFAVDGHTQEIHEKYRRKTDLAKVLENMESLSYTYARPRAVTIVFKHNQKYISDISKLVYEHGSKVHVWYPTDRFAEWNDYKTEFFEHGKEAETLLPAVGSEFVLWTDHNWYMLVGDTTQTIGSNADGKIIFEERREHD
jgi:MoaA/NifB/PqqE/SkfB family radical SAM enzyme